MDGPPGGVLFYVLVSCLNTVMKMTDPLQALAEQLNWLEHCPNAPRLQVHWDSAQGTYKNQLVSA